MRNWLKLDEIAFILVHVVFIVCHDFCEANLLKNKISSPDTIEADAQGFPDFKRILELLQKAARPAMRMLCLVVVIVFFDLIDRYR